MSGSTGIEKENHAVVTHTWTTLSNHIYARFLNYSAVTGSGSTITTILSQHY